MSATPVSRRGAAAGGNDAAGPGAGRGPLADGGDARAAVGSAEPLAPPVALRFRGPLAALTTAERSALLERAAVEDARVRDSAAGIVARVRAEGDAALFALARELDGVALPSLEVPRERVLGAPERIAPALRAALERAARNIASVHRAFAPAASEIETEPGVWVGRRPDAYERVGVYAPGGRARYPSSVLMGAIPARIAGVREIVLCTPPGPGGTADDLPLAAAALAGVDRVFAVGGAGAIAALAYGTASVPRAAKIVGPGNAYVAAAKRLVAAEGAAACDAPAGPSELLVIADESADPERVALELIAQAEHDPDACALAVALGADVAARLEAALARHAATAARGEIVRAALAAAGGVLVAGSRDEALDFAARYAPEHLLLAVRDPESALIGVRDAGTVFLGAGHSVTFGDYLTGANHVLPTAGFARLGSGLSTLDFVRWTTWQRIGPGAAAGLAADLARLADAEGLPGHAAAARAAGAADTAAGGESLPARGPLEPGADDSPCVALDDNTSLFGAPPAATAALGARAGDASRYPSPDADELRAALAEYAGADPDEIVTGCGSDDVLDLAFRALAGPGDTITWSAPTFSMIPEFARHNRLRGRAVPSLADGAPDVEALLGGDPAIVYLCSPNNPTGEVVPASSLDALLARAPGVVVLDQAYAEFEAGGLAPPAPRHPRLLVARTLSKAFGLAGLRVGYGVAPAAIAARLAAVRGPYRVGGPSGRAAVAALREDRAWVAARAAEAVAIRERLAGRLRALGFTPLPSRANFLLVPVADARGFAERLRSRGVLVRPFAGLERVGDAIRVGVGPWPLMERFLARMREVLR